MKQTRIKKVASILIFPALIGILVYLFRTEFMAYVIEPIGRFFWAIWSVLSRLDQNILWNFAIFLTAALAFLLFPSTRYEKQNSAYEYDYRSEASTSYWNTLLQKSILESEGEQALTLAVQKLALDYMELEDGHATRGEPDRLLLHMPSSVSRSLGFVPQTKTPRWKRLIHRSRFLVPRFLRKIVLRQKPSVPAEFLDTIQWMEIELGIENHGEEK